MKSIRQLADDLKLSHTAVRSAILELEADLGHPIGKSQGRGKPTLLNERECEQITSKFFKPAFLREAAPKSESGITLRQSDSEIDVHQTEKLTLTVTDSTAQLAQAIQRLEGTLKQFIGNSQTLESALIQRSTMQGAELGTQMAIAKVGAAVKASEAIELDLAKKLGLVQDSPAN